MMGAIGVAVDFAFAIVVLKNTVVAYQLLLDRIVSKPIAVITSAHMTVQKIRAYCRTWGLNIAGSPPIGSLPMLLGLVIVVPVLGHATWHLYRKAVVE